MTERQKLGRRSRESTAISMTEEGVLREVALCVQEIAERTIPRYASTSAPLYLS